MNKSNVDIYNPFYNVRGEDFDPTIYLESILSTLVGGCGEIIDHPIDILEKSYQVVIMAAGEGTRMGLDYPKALFQLNYPYGQNTILENTLVVLDKITDKLESIKIIIRAGTREHFKQIVKRNSKVQLIELPEALIRGTANCLFHIKSQINTNIDLILLWGDVALIPVKYIFVTLLMSERVQPAITIPTRYKLNPYVAFERDEKGTISSVHHSHEGLKYEGWAEQDALCFVLKKDTIDLLERFLVYYKNNVRQFKEIDFIHFIPYCASFDDKQVIGLPVCRANFVQGLNTTIRADALNHYFSQISKSEYQDIYLTIM